jgi:hypothetical protein
MKTIICMYMKECKYCQLINDFLEYLSSTDKIKYIRINVSKTIQHMANYMKINKMDDIKIVFPCIYLLSENNLITLNVDQMLYHSIKYRESLINNPKQKSFFDKFMLSHTI